MSMLWLRVILDVIRLEICALYGVAHGAYRHVTLGTHFLVSERILHILRVERRSLVRMDKQYLLRRGIVLLKRINPWAHPRLDNAQVIPAMSQLVTNISRRQIT